MTHFEQPGQKQPPVVVYGTEWCAATQMVRRYLESKGILYQFRDMDQDPSAENQVRWWTGGDSSHPTLQVGGEILIEPTNSDLQLALARYGLV